jgi:hypothetical protein
MGLDNYPIGYPGKKIRNVYIESFLFLQQQMLASSYFSFLARLVDKVYIPDYYLYTNTNQKFGQQARMV